ncbi:MAG: AAA family ATPase [Verrucomicrobiaceae bacterium]|nr:AAA family ATPase [Verrucomicrobiaceae bacterium]
MSAKPAEQPLNIPSVSQTQEARELIEGIVTGVSTVILGKADAVRLAVACLLARGHLLFEDIPGVGKTMLSQALAQALGLQFRRVQFTSDLLPADILGASIYDREKAAFVFHPGPVFAQVLLADEINRGTPKTQSALLEAMEEGRVTADGVTHPLPSPFFVIATQNPLTQIGTFPLPESQLDRFLMRLELGIPDREAERAMLEGGDRRAALQALRPAMDGAQLTAMQQLAQRIHAAPALLDYLQDLLGASRQLARGLSPRAGLALLSAARAWALMQGRPMVIPEDIQAVGTAVMAHRLEHSEQGASGVVAATHLMQNTPVV